MTSFPEPPSEIKAMMKRYMAVAALAAFPMVAQAETPNVTPGEWEFVSVTSVSGDMQIPDQTETERQCITQEELEGADFGFIEEEEGCEESDIDEEEDAIEEIGRDLLKADTELGGTTPTRRWARERVFPLGRRATASSALERIFPGAACSLQLQDIPGSFL